MAWGLLRGCCPPHVAFLSPRGAGDALLLWFRPLGEPGLHCPGDKVAVMELALNN